MIFAAILAGGIGSRMGGTDTPKQFLTLGNKPVIIHTIEKFVINENIDKTIVLIPKNFINHTNNLIEEYMGNNEDIIVIEGGDTRNDTLLNSIKYIDENFGIDDDSIILTHDSVRPNSCHRHHRWKRQWQDYWKHPREGLLLPRPNATKLQYKKTFQFNQ